MNPVNIPTVLVVEDEELVRAYAAEMIEEVGWRALEAGNSAEALRLLSTHPEVDVVFTDITMPGELDGLALAERVHRLHPHVELVVTSGKHVIANDNLPDDGTFIRKPYGLDDLVEVMGKKLAGKN
jgi:CheY-like chemotaxis protein